MADSKKILLILAGKSALNGSFTLSRALVEQGHKVFYITSEINDREYVESQGFTYLIVPENDFKLPYPSSASVKNAVRRRIQNACNRIAVLDYKWEQAEIWIDETKPDVVILDQILTHFAVPFLKKKVPIINITPTLSTIYHAGRPPIFSSLTPPRTTDPLAKIRMKMAWLSIFLDQYYREYRSKFFLQLATGSQSKWIKTVLKKNGAKMTRAEYGTRLIGPEILMGSGYFDFPPLPGSENQPKWYIGACVEEKRAQEDFDFSFLDKNKKLIYCAMGTNSFAYKHQKNLYRSLFEAMEQLPHCQLILQTEGVGESTEYKRIPKNVIVVTRAPQLKLLQLTDLFITHGGAGSTREGAYYGVPMIVFPGWHDQPGNAARVVYHGLGAKGDMRTITTKKILSLIDKTMNDPNIRESSRKMSEKLRKDDNRPAIVKFIESYSSSWHA